MVVHSCLMTILADGQSCLGYSLFCTLLYEVLSMQKYL